MRNILAAVKERVRQYLISEESAVLRRDMKSVDQKKIKADLATAVDHMAMIERTSLTPEEKEKIVSELVDEVLGLGPLSVLMSDPAVTEIMVNGPDLVYVERNGQMTVADIRFENNRQLMQTIERMLGSKYRRVDESCPFVDTSLPDGSRVNIILPPLSLIGPVVTIRKFLRELVTIDDLLKRRTLNETMAQLLIVAIKAKLNIIFAGATGVGKTTTLNILSAYIDEDERIVTIEDTSELRLKQNHVVPLEARQSNVDGKGEVTIRDLFKNSLRMRPDRIILGEIRGSEALDMLQAASSGHQGSLAVLHASSPEDVVSRIETMIIMSGTAIPLWAIRQQISNAIDLIVVQQQLTDGSRKITHITEVQGMEKDEIVLKDLFTYQIKGINAQTKSVIGDWQPGGILPSFYPRLALRGLDIPKSVFGVSEG